MKVGDLVKVIRGGAPMLPHYGSWGIVIEYLGLNPIRTGIASMRTVHTYGVMVNNKIYKLSERNVKCFYENS